MLEQQTLLKLIGSSPFNHFPSNLKLVDFVKETKLSGQGVDISILLPFPCEGLITSLKAELKTVLHAKWPDNQFNIQIKQNLPAYKTKAGVEPNVQV